LVDAGARAFAELSFDDVTMEDVAHAAGVSRALLYRHFASKRDLFAAVYQRAADQLLANTKLDPDIGLVEQVRVGLDVHLDYFLANRAAVLAANRTLAGDPTIQAIINDELSVLRARMLDFVAVPAARRQVVSSVLISWLVFVRALSVDWLIEPSCTRDELREVCTNALVAALQPILNPPVENSRPAGVRRGTDRPTSTRKAPKKRSQPRVQLVDPERPPCE
jgi:AcrR family transcriptional regulator